MNFNWKEFFQSPNNFPNLAVVSIALLLFVAGAALWRFPIGSIVGGGALLLLLAAGGRWKS